VEYAPPPLTGSFPPNNITLRFCEAVMDEGFFGAMNALPTLTFFSDRLRLLLSCRMSPSLDVETFRRENLFPPPSLGWPLSQSLSLRGHPTASFLRMRTFL